MLISFLRTRHVSTCEQNCYICTDQNYYSWRLERCSWGTDLGMIWHFIDEKWLLKAFQIGTLNTGKAPKACQVVGLYHARLSYRKSVIDSNRFSIHTVKSDNGAAVALSCEMLSNFVRSVPWIVHSIALLFVEVFEEGRTGSMYMDQVDAVTKYFNRHNRRWFWT